MGALLQMSALDVRDLIVQSIDSVSRHEMVRCRISATVSNRIAMENGPALMVLGVLREECTEAEGDNVGVVGKGGVCLGCGESASCDQGHVQWPVPQLWRVGPLGGRMPECPQGVRHEGRVRARDDGRSHARA